MREHMKTGINDEAEMFEAPVKEDDREYEQFERGN